MEQTTKEAAGPNPISMTIDIPAASLKKVIEQGKLVEFVDTLSSRAAAHIRAQVVAAATRGGAGVSFRVGFDDDDRYGTGPRPWPHPWGVFENAMKEIAMKEIIAKQR
ncbi:MAG: hypothetical protein SFV54_04790 [Bryobacteraceae bacterium]|nr:hypothetical protein [Bryobacteraceae bacterium]